MQAAGSPLPLLEKALLAAQSGKNG